MENKTMDKNIMMMELVKFWDNMGCKDMMSIK